MNWLLTADWHLPPRPATVGWAGIPECRDDEWTALQDVVELCVQRKAHLAVAGDIFDAPQIAPRCLDRLFDTLKPLQENALQCVYILGNHDAGFDWLRNVPQTQSVRRGLQRIDEITVSGVDFCDDFTPPQLPIVSDLGLYHQAWKELTKRGSYAIAELPAHRVSVCGDIHISQLFTYEQSYRPPRFALSPGPLVPQKIDEVQTGYGSAWVWDTEQLGPPVCESLKQRRGYYRHRGAAGDTILEELKTLATQDANHKRVTPAFVLEVTGYSRAFRDFAKSYAERNGFLLAVRAATESEVKPQTLMEVRHYSRTSLTDVIKTWPGLAQEDATVALQLAEAVDHGNMEHVDQLVQTI